MKHLLVAMLAATLFPWGGSAGSLTAQGAGFPKSSIPMIQCQPLTILDARIRYCTDNIAAITSAEECSRQVSLAWEKAAPELALLNKQTSLSQKSQLNQSEEKLQLAIWKMDRLIQETGKAADLIALYPTVMVDTPGISKGEESLPCYSTAFLSIQQKVNSLDAKTKEGMATLAQAKQLRTGVRAALSSVQSTESLGTTLITGGRGESAKANSQNNRNPTSDITGTKEKRKLN